jgi:hypothetical protein
MPTLDNLTPSPYPSTAGTLVQCYTNDGIAEAAVDAIPTDAPLAVGAGIAFVSPASLMAYCQTQMNTYNSQMDSIFLQQESTNQFSAQVNTAISTFNQYSAGINVTGGTQLVGEPGTLGDPNAPPTGPFGQLVTQLQQLQSEASACGMSNAAQTIGNAITSLTTDGNGGTDNKCSSGDIANILQDLNGATSDTSSSDQMQMISLNSLMSEEQTAVQLTTNMMQTFSQMNESITANMKPS